MTTSKPPFDPATIRATDDAQSYGVGGERDQGISTAPTATSGEGGL